MLDPPSSGFTRIAALQAPTAANSPETMAFGERRGGKLPVFQPLAVVV
jgi:hypothetical protein